MSTKSGSNRSPWEQYFDNPTAAPLNVVPPRGFDEDEKERRRLLNKEKETDIALKEKYGNTILGILIAWLSFVGLLLLAKYGPNGGKLSDGILITLITTTTLDILILPKIVLQYLFPQNKKRED